MATFDFRILLETVEGVKSSYMSQSFVDTSQELVLSASQAYSRITGSVSCSYQNQLIFSGSNLNTSKTFKNNLLLSSSLQGGVITGSIDFTATTGEYDRLLRYKFFGEKVCNVLGLPHAQWVYVDQFSLNSDNDNNFFEGNVNAQNLFVGDSLTFANDSTINSDIPFLINTGSDRHVKFIDERGFGSRALIIGYDKDNDTYEVSGSHDNIFNIGGVDKLVFADGTIQTSAGGGGSGVVAGVDTTVQFNDGGNFGGDAGFTYNKNTDTITLAGGINAKGDISSSGDIFLESGDFLFLNSPESGDDRIRYNSSTGILLQSEKVTIDTDAAGVNIVGHITGSANLKIAGNLIVDGEVQATSITSSRVTASVVYASGSNIFGDEASDTHTFNGNITASGNISASGGTSVFGQVVHLEGTDPRLRLKAKGANHPGIEWWEDSTRKWVLFSDPDSSQGVNDNLTFKNASDTELMELDQDGMLYVSSKIIHLDDTDTFINFTGDDINIQAGGVNMLDFTQNDASQDEITFNETGADLDVRIEGDTDANLLFTDAGNDRVGIGTNTPVDKLHVQGNITASGNIEGDSIRSNNKKVIKYRADIDEIRVGAVNTPLRITGSYLTLGSASSGDAFHVTASGNISSSGKVITTEVESHTDFTLDVGGDITLDADGADIILSDNGTNFGRFKRDSSDFIIKSEANNNDIVFRGQDGGATITAMTIDMSEGGRVGIGTTSPADLLHVSGANGTEAVIETVSAGEAKVLSLRNNLANDTTSDSVSIQFSPDNRQPNGARIIVGKDADFSTGANIDTNMQFVTVRNNSSNEVMRLTSDERVGIGTTSPSSKLTVAGDISASGTVFADAFQSVTGGSTIDFNDSLDLTGNITASGNISASGTSHTFGGTINADEIHSITQTTNKLILEDDQTLASNMVSLMGVNFVNLIADGNNNGTGKVRILDGNYDVDSATEVAEFSPEGIDFNANITASGNISSSAKITMKEFLLQPVANNVTPFVIRNVDAQKQMDLSIDTNQHSELGLFKDGGEKIRFNTYWPAIIDNDFYETNGALILGSDATQQTNKYGLYVSDGPDSGSAYFADKVQFVSQDAKSGSMVVLAHDSDAILSTNNDSADGHPQQFVLKHNFGDTELINRRGDLILSASSGRIGIGTNNPQEALDISGSGIIIHNGNTDGFLKIKRFSGDIGQLSAANTRLTMRALSNKDISIEDDSGNVGVFVKDGGNVMIGSTNTPSEKLEVDGNIKTRGNISSPTFVSGFAGSGYRITSGSTGKQSIEIDDLTVRGSMSIYELLIHQIRATNGSLFISNIGKVDSASRAGTTNVGTTGDNGTIFTIFFDTGSGTENLGTGGHSFLPGDIIRAQRFAPNANGSGSQIMVSDAEVTSVVNQKEAVVTVKSGTSHPTASFEYVRIGNTGSADRQGSIFMTSDDQNAPYIDVIDGVVSHSNFNSTGTTKVRMGKLTGITTTTFGTLPGYGFYASGSAFLEGSINATNGSIGGFTITNSHISASGLLMQSSGKITASAVDLSGKITATRGQIGGFTIDGHSLTTDGVEINDSTQDAFINTDNFDVDHKGNITASNVDLTGKITATSGEFAGALEATHINATSGSIGGFKIDDTSISSSNGALRLKSNGQITGSNVQFLSGEIANWTVGTGRISAELEPGDGTPGKVIISSTSSIGINQGHIYDEDKNFMKGFSVRTRAASNAWNFNMGEVLLDADGTTLSAGGTGSYAPNRWYGINVVRQTDTHHDKELFVIAASGSDNAGDGFQARIAGWSFDENEFKSSNLSGGGDGTFTTAGILMNKAGYISAPAFSLSSAGNLTISGTLSSSIGNIGGFTIGASSIESRTSQQSGNFTASLTLNSNGQITGSSVLFTGGKVGGFTITDSHISASVNRSGLLLSSSGHAELAGGNIKIDKFGNLDITDARLRISSNGFQPDAFNSSLGKFVDTIHRHGNVTITAFEDDTIVTRISSSGEIRDTLVLSASQVSANMSDRQAGDIYDANKPIFAYNTAGVPLIPFTAASKEFVARIDRYNPSDIHFFSPFGEAEVHLASGSNDGLFQKTAIDFVVSQSLLVSQSTNRAYPDATVEFYQITSSLPILVSANATNNSGNIGDFVFIPPPSKEVLWHGEASKTGHSTLTTPNQTISNHKNLYYFSDAPFNHMDSGDGAGGDAEHGLPIEMLGDTYIVPHTLADYRMTAVEPGIVKVFRIENGVKTLHKSYNVSASKEVPQTMQEGTIAGSGTNLFTAQAVRFEGTMPFYLRVNDPTNDDEYTVLGYRRTQTPQYQNSTTIEGDRVKTGKIQSNNFSTTLGTELDLDNATFKLGGSSDPTLQFDGTSLKVSGSITASSGIIGGFETTATQISSSGLLFKAAGQITMSGGTLTTTKVGGGDFIEIDGVDNDLKFMNAGTQTITIGKLGQGASIGGGKSGVSTYGMEIENAEAQIYIKKTSSTFGTLGANVDVMRRSPAILSELNIGSDGDKNENGMASILGEFKHSNASFDDTGIFGAVVGRISGSNANSWRSSALVGIDFEQAGVDFSRQFEKVPARHYGLVSIGESLIDGNLFITGSGHITASGTGSFGAIKVGGGNFTSASLASAVAGGGGGGGSGDITGVDLTGGSGITISNETNTTSGDYSSTISVNATTISGSWLGYLTGSNNVHFNHITASGNISGSSTSTFKIGGKLQAGSKSFLIPRPEGGMLEYGALEGQQNDVFFRGELKGDNVIYLPQEWEWLVDENTITVQLTSIGKHQELFVKEIKDNKIFIGINGMCKGKNNIHCYHIIHGTRKDVELIRNYQ